MRAYGSETLKKTYRDDYTFSRNHSRAVVVRKWKRNLKKRARSRNRMFCHIKLNTLYEDL